MSGYLQLVSMWYQTEGQTNLVLLCATRDEAAALTSCIIDCTTCMTCNLMVVAVLTFCREEQCLPREKRSRQWAVPLVEDVAWKITIFAC